MKNSENNRSKINQGDIYWLGMDEDIRYGSEHPHPHVVIQDDRSAVILCVITTNMKKVSLPGNILLEVGEANLPKQSIVDVSQMVSVKREALGEYIGSLSGKRVEEIFRGIRFLQRMIENRT